MAVSLIGRTRRRHRATTVADGRFYHEDGKAKFLFEMPAEMPEPPSEKYPFLLLTAAARLRSGYADRTKKSAVLRQLYPAEIYVELNPEDARRLRITSNQRAVVESQRGSLVAKAFVTRPCSEGSASSHALRNHQPAHAGSF